MTEFFKYRDALASRAALISEYRVNDGGTAVTFVIPALSHSHIEAVKEQMQEISQSPKDAANIVTAEEKGTLTITVKSASLATMALNVTKIMTRRMRDLKDDVTIHFATTEDMLALLDKLETYARPNDPSQPKAVISSMRSVVGKIALM